jgi:hypothetical protein
MTEEEAIKPEKEKSYRKLYIALLFYVIIKRAYTAFYIILDILEIKRHEQ